MEPVSGVCDGAVTKGKMNMEIETRPDAYEVRRLDERDVDVMRRKI